jgi:hypothetical protein
MIVKLSEKNKNREFSSYTRPFKTGVAPITRASSCTTAIRIIDTKNYRQIARHKNQKEFAP